MAISPKEVRSTAGIGAEAAHLARQYRRPVPRALDGHEAPAAWPREGVQGAVRRC